MDSAKACELLNAQLDKINSLKNQVYEKFEDDPVFIQWKRETLDILRKTFSDDSREVKDFETISYRGYGPCITTHTRRGKVLSVPKPVFSEKGLEQAKALLKSAVNMLQVDVSSTLITTRDKTVNVFISHGTHSAALDKIERFVRAFGFEPVIVKDKASEGKAVDELVDEKMQGCQCVIILATKDDKVKDYYQPRPNVLHEVGKAQHLYLDKIIYLKEEGCQFPSNITPKVWGDFTQDNMEAAFLKIVKEFKASGFI